MSFGKYKNPRDFLLAELFAHEDCVRKNPDKKGPAEEPKKEGEI